MSSVHRLSRGLSMITQKPPPPLPSVLGSWTYRSFINSPDVSKEFNELEFGRGELIIDCLAPEFSEGVLPSVTPINSGWQACRNSRFLAHCAFKGLAIPRTPTARSMIMLDFSSRCGRTASSRGQRL